MTSVHYPSFKINRLLCFHWLPAPASLRSFSPLFFIGKMRNRSCRYYRMENSTRNEFWIDSLFKLFFLRIYTVLRQFVDRLNVELKKIVAGVIRRKKTSGTLSCAVCSLDWVHAHVQSRRLFIMVHLNMIQRDWCYDKSAKSHRTKPNTVCQRDPH